MVVVQEEDDEGGRDMKTWEGNRKGEKIEENKAFVLFLRWGITLHSKDSESMGN